MTDEIMRGWQQRLIDVAATEGRPYPLPKFGPDGLGGIETRDAIKDFQAAHVLPLTGQFDAATRAALQSITTRKDSPMTNILGSIFSGLLGNIFTWTLVQGYIRDGLKLAAGAIGLDGLVGADGTKIITASLLAIIGVVWSALSNNRKVHAIEVVKAVDASPTVTLIKAQDTTLGKPIVASVVGAAGMKIGG